MKYLSNQQIFDTVTEHLLKQARQAKESRNMGCALYYAGDLRCAIGCLIPVDLYRKEMEAETVAGLDDVSPGIWKQLRIDYMDSYPILMALQSIHDQLPVWLWPEELEQLAKEHGLEWRPVKWRRLIQRKIDRFTRPRKPEHLYE